MVADAAADGEQDVRGLRALDAESFSVLDSVGGVRGLVESMLPGTVFVVVYVATQSLRPTLWASVGVAVALVVARLVARTPPTHAFGGLVGVGIGVVWAATSGKAENYYAVGLLTNAAYLVACVVSILVRWPAVGLVVEGLRSGFGGTRVVRPAPDATPRADAGSTGPGEEPAAPSGQAVPSVRAMLPTAWRADAELVRRYALATWLWVGMFGLRLAVQVPLYFHHEVGWLGTARLVMGLPLWGATLWLTWVVVPHLRRATPAT
ncbi:uncharacterized protein DUF3159 [Luteimicrobium subarcticum]|uniref:Uncharacterized protein DUF3159 n=1 Tax=Luteimicrobium subarcticum TaxID=620910 RepID=A0A2M8W446_9MICO|nr:uncharacterized protein DUF3159 [Luteimicrobium subarcticum]